MRERRVAVNPHYSRSSSNEMVAILIVVAGGVFAVGLMLGYLWGIS